MENMSIYEQSRNCPSDALKPIQAGRLKGKSDINPMWRIKKLTELFGAVGIGWYYEITKQWTEQGANGEIAAFCNINLYIKNSDEWSKPIQGTGGSAFIAKEKNGLYTSDECYKMALTDAISVACKALGFAADVYWDSDSTKYSREPKIDDTKDSDSTNDSKSRSEPDTKKTKPKPDTQTEPKTQEPNNKKEYKCVDCGKPFEAFTAKSTGKTYTVAQAYHISETKYGRALCKDCGEKTKRQQEKMR